MNKSLPKTFSLVLGGGGIRGYAHIGVWQYLEEQNMLPAEIVGASIGAIVGAFIAFGFTSQDLKEISSSLPKTLLLQPDLRTGLLSQRKIESFLTQFLGGDTKIEDAKIKLKIIVTNFETGEKEVLTSGPLIPAILASACLPALFAPVKIKGQTYIDGGATDNLPVSEAYYTDIIAVSVIADTLHKSSKGSKYRLPLPVFTMGKAYDNLMKSFRILLVSRERSLIEANQGRITFIAPAVGNIGMLDIRKGTYAIGKGYEAARETLEI